MRRAHAVAVAILSVPLMAGALANQADRSEIEGIRVTWREVSDVLVERFGELSDLELKERAPVEFPVGDGTVLGGIAFLLQHESFHIGQLAFLRKMLGHGSMSYW